MTSAHVDELAVVLRGPATTEACELIRNLRPSDLTACELLALVGILRPAWERKQAEQWSPAPALELVRPGKRRRR